MCEITCYLEMAETQNGGEQRQVLRQPKNGLQNNSLVTKTCTAQTGVGLDPGSTPLSSFLLKHTSGCDDGFTDWVPITHAVVLDPA